MGRFRIGSDVASTGLAAGGKEQRIRNDFQVDRLSK